MTYLFLWPFAAVLGGLIGSFLNVVVWRVPRGESLAFPASHCPHCEHQIRGYDNIPVVSWLVLRGKCRDCGTRISLRYPLVELSGVLAFTGVFLFEALAYPGRFDAPFILSLVAFLYLAAITIALTLIDIDVHRLPNSIVVPSYAVMIILLGAATVVGGDAWPLVRGLIGGAALFVLYYLLAVVYPGGMGFGDVKLAGVLGFTLAWLGWGSLAVGAFAAFLLGGVFGVLLLLVRRVGRRTRIPFGPWMLGGAWIGILVGAEISASYLHLFGIA